MRHERDREHQQRGQDRNRRPHAEESEPGADGDELRDQRQKVADHQVDHREPAPERTEAIEDQLGVPAMSGRAQTHGHFLHHASHEECEHHERQEKTDAESRPGRRIRQHAGTIILSKHHQNAGANEQPEQPQPRPESAPGPRHRYPFAVVRAIDVLVGDDDVTARNSLIGRQA